MLVLQENSYGETLQLSISPNILDGIRDGFSEDVLNILSDDFRRKNLLDILEAAIYMPHPDDKIVFLEEVCRELGISLDSLTQKILFLINLSEQNPESVIGYLENDLDKNVSLNIQLIFLRAILLNKSDFSQIISSINIISRKPIEDFISEVKEKGKISEKYDFESVFKFIKILLKTGYFESKILDNDFISALTDYFSYHFGNNPELYGKGNDLFKAREYILFDQKQLKDSITSIKAYFSNLNFSKKPFILNFRSLPQTQGDISLIYQESSFVKGTSENVFNSDKIGFMKKFDELIEAHAKLLSEGSVISISVFEPTFSGNGGTNGIIANDNNYFEDFRMSA